MAGKSTLVNLMTGSFVASGVIIHEYEIPTIFSGVRGKYIIPISNGWNFYYISFSLLHLFVWFFVCRLRENFIETGSIVVFQISRSRIIYGGRKGFNRRILN